MTVHVLWIKSVPFFQGGNHAWAPTQGHSIHHHLRWQGLPGGRATDVEWKAASHRDRSTQSTEMLHGYDVHDGYKCYRHLRTLGVDVVL